MIHRVKSVSLLVLGTFAAMAAISPSVHAAAIGISSPAGAPISFGSDSWDNIQLQSITSTSNQVVFKATLNGGGQNVAATSAFTYFTDASNEIRDVLYVNLADNGATSTLYFNYSAHGDFGTADAPAGTIIDPKTMQSVNLASLPSVSAVSELTTQAGNGYVVNSDLKSTTTGRTSAFVPYLAVYLYADESAAQTSATPEPSSFLLLPVALAGVLAMRKKLASK